MDELMLQTGIHAMASKEEVEQRVSNINNDTKETRKTTISYATTYPKGIFTAMLMSHYILHISNKFLNLLNNVLQPCLPFGVLAV